MKQTTIITFSVREIYFYLSNTFYDIYVYDRCEDFEMGYNLFNSLKSPETFIQNLKDGFSACILPKFGEIEELVKNNNEFVIIVRDHKDDIWAVINGSDINF